MPQAIAQVIIAATGATGTAATLITVGTYVATTAVTVYAASEAAKAAAEDALKSLESNMGTQTTMQFRTDHPRRLIYGTTKLSGPVAYVATSGSDNKYLHMIVLLGEGPITAIDDVYLGDTNLNLSQSGTDSNGQYRYVPGSGNRYDGLVRVKKHLGGTTQDADADAAGECSEWTNAHRLRGIAYLYIRLQYDKDKLASIPNISCIVRGKQVYDTRDSTTKFSNNPALCIRDYLLSENGLGADSSEVDDNRISEMANVCDHDPTTDTVTTTVADRRYTLDGTISLASSPIEVMDQMLATCGGSIPYVQGKHRLQVAFDIPQSRKHTVDDSFLRGSVQIQTDGGKAQRINSVRGTFMDPDNNYNVVDFAPYTDSTYIAEDGQKLWSDVSFNLVKQNTRAQRIAKMLVERNRQNMSVKLKCNLKAFGIAVNDGITFSLDPDGSGGASAIFTNKLFKVTGWKLNPDGSIDLEAVEETDLIYDWNNGDSFGIDTAPNTSLPSPRFTAPPTSVTATEVASIQNDGTSFTAMEVSWAAASDAFVGEYLVTIAINLSNTNTPNYVAMTSLKVGSTNTKVVVPGLIVGRQYIAQVTAISVIGVSSAVAQSAALELTGDSTAPGVINVTATAGHKQNVLSWTNPTDADFAGVEIKRKTATGKPTAAAAGDVFVSGVPGQAQNAIDAGLTNGTTYRYWIRTKDFSGNKSDWRPDNNNGVTAAPAAENLSDYNNDSAFVDANGAATAAPIQSVQLNGTTITADSNGAVDVEALVGVSINGTAVTASTGSVDLSVIETVKINGTEVAATEDGEVDLSVLTGIEFNGTALTVSNGSTSLSALTGVTFGTGGSSATVASDGSITIGKFAEIDQINATNAATFIADTVITNDMLAGSITAGKIQTTTLSAIASNVGTVTAGTLQSTDGNFVIDLTNKTITITV